MGHEIPAAMGIRLREGPEGAVVAVIGDGTYLMAPTELFTAVQERMAITVVVLDNGGYQSISRLALGGTGASAGNEFRGRGADGRLPDGAPVRADIAANARSLGCAGVVAATAEELRAALDRARERTDRPTVIVCPTAPERSLLPSGAFWDLGVPEVAASADTRARTAAFLAARRGAAIPVRLATGPVTWGVDFADAPGNPPWQEVLDEIAASGLGALELGPVGYLPEDPAALRAALAGRGLTAVGSFVFDDLHDPARAGAVVAAARRACAAIAAADGARARRHRPARAGAGGDRRALGGGAAARAAGLGGPDPHDGPRGGRGPRPRAAAGRPPARRQLARVRGRARAPARRHRARPLPRHRPPRVRGDRPRRRPGPIRGAARRTCT